MEETPQLDRWNVRILRKDPNSLSGSTSQVVSLATVSCKEMALLFEDYQKGRKDMDTALNELDVLTFNRNARIMNPLSVYINVHKMHASVFFLPTDMGNRTGENVEETKRLVKMGHGLRVYFTANSFQIINPLPVRRVDLSTVDGKEYTISAENDVLKPNTYTMFKCFEVIGNSHYDLEWAYLMAARDWYDLAANNCLSFSKRVIREYHRQITGSDLDSEEMKKLNALYVSVPGEDSLEKFQSRISFFMSRPLQPVIAIILVLILVAIYIEIRLRF